MSAKQSMALLLCSTRTLPWKDMAGLLKAKLDVDSIDFIRPFLSSDPIINGNGSGNGNVDRPPMAMLHFNSYEAFHRALTGIKKNASFELFPLFHTYDRRFNVFVLDNLPMESSEAAERKIKESLLTHFIGAGVHIITGTSKKPLEKYNGTATVILVKFGIPETVTLADARGYTVCIASTAKN